MIRLRFAARAFVRRLPRTWVAWGEGRLIRQWTLSDVSHVDIVMLDGQLLGARADGVWLRPEGYAPFRNVIDIEIPATPEQEAVFFPLAEKQIGKPYDNIAFVAFILNRRDWHHEGQWTCSELPIWLLEQSGIIEEVYPPVWRVTPSMALAIVSAIPGRRLSVIG